MILDPIPIFCYLFILFSLCARAHRSHIFPHQFVWPDSYKLVYRNHSTIPNLSIYLFILHYLRYRPRATIAAHMQIYVCICTAYCLDISISMLNRCTERASIRSRTVSIHPVRAPTHTHTPLMDLLLPESATTFDCTYKAIKDLKGLKCVMELFGNSTEIHLFPQNATHIQNHMISTKIKTRKAKGNSFQV